MRRVLIGHIPVDSACIVIADPGELRQFDSTTQNLDELLPPGCPDLNHMHRFSSPELPFSREACWVAKSSRERGGILGAQRGESQRFGVGVAVSTGLGDGLYPVYAEIIEPDDLEDPEDRFMLCRVARVIVDFELDKLGDAESAGPATGGEGRRDLQARQTKEERMSVVNVDGRLLLGGDTAVVLAARLGLDKAIGGER